MYPSSSSSSYHGSMGPTNTGQGGGGRGSSLTRYDSAPGCLLTTAVDSLMGPNRDFSLAAAVRPQTQMFPPPFFPASDTSSVSSESTCKANKSSSYGLQRTFGFSGMGIGTDQFGIESKTGPTSGGGGGGGAGTSSSSLVRHSSSPAGFLHHLSATVDNGFSLARGTGSYGSKGTSESGTGMSMLNSQLSFTRQDSLSQISGENQNLVDGISTENSQRKAAHAFASASFGRGSWDDTNAIIFSAPPSKRAKNIGSDPVSSLGAIESQLQFGLTHRALEMGTVESVLIPEDSVPCKIRAKRGCATHPRSIAERERRTRISEKLKKLQELVPNMDKQTSYADMLDLAVQHIKGLQHEVQKLNKELENCTCGCKPNTQS